MSETARRYCSLLEQLRPENLEELKSHIAADVHFKDPFNDVRSADLMIAIFADLFENVEQIEFKVNDLTSGKDVTLITWSLRGILRGELWHVDGASRLTFDADGKLTEHIDYWDAASDLYEHFPVIGWLLRAIRRRLRIAP